LTICSSSRWSSFFSSQVELYMREREAGRFELGAVIAFLFVDLCCPFGEYVGDRDLFDEYNAMCEVFDFDEYLR
jgi:hypothetical protein